MAWLQQRTSKSQNTPSLVQGWTREKKSPAPFFTGINFKLMVPVGGHCWGRPHIQVGCQGNLLTMAGLPWASSPTHPLITTPVISQAPQLLMTLITIEKKIIWIVWTGHLYASVLNCRNFEGTVLHDQEDLINKKQYLVIIYCYSLIPLSVFLFYVGVLLLKMVCLWHLRLCF